MRRDGAAGGPPASRATAHLWISSPLDAGDGPGRLDRRIAALRDM